MTACSASVLIETSPHSPPSQFFFLHLLVKPQFDRQEEETDVVPLPTAMFGGRLCYRSYFVKSIVLLLWVCFYCKYNCAFRSFSDVCHKYNSNVLYLFAS